MNPDQKNHSCKSCAEFLINSGQAKERGEILSMLMSLRGSCKSKWDKPIEYIIMMIKKNSLKKCYKQKKQ